MVLHDSAETIALIRTVLEHLRQHREFAPYELQDLALLAGEFREAVDDFRTFLDEAKAEEPETSDITVRFRKLAEEVAAALPANAAAALVALLVMAPHPELLTKSGSFRKYQKKGKWGAAAKRASLAKADAERLHDAASAHYALCRETWTVFRQAVATHVLAGLVPLVEPVMDLFRKHKQVAALLDFDDLIFSARDLLRDHDAWSDEARAVEGRPDAQEEAVALYTIHAAKGLEWPIVVPINAITQVMAANRAVTDRVSGRFYCHVFGVEPNGYEVARDEEKTELDRERVRLWYVAATRAREFLVLPRLYVDATASAWLSVVDLDLPGLPALDLDHLPSEVGAGEPNPANEQSREVFAAEAAAIAERMRTIVWRTPSRDEGEAQPVPGEAAPTILSTDSDGAPTDSFDATKIQGGRERGLILHKLIEEVLTGETAETRQNLHARAVVLIRALNQLAPAELADCVVRALSLTEIVDLKHRLVPELSVYGSSETDTQEEATAGVVDAITFDADDKPEVVIDWKSDVEPSPETVRHYRAQIRDYLDMTGAERGLVVFVTSGIAIPVVRNGFGSEHRAHPSGS